MRARLKTPLLRVGVGVAGALVMWLVACSNGSGGGGTCAQPPFLNSTCGACIENACSATVAASCGSFSSCYCTCIAESGKTVESCTLSCASTSCTSATAACIESSLRTGGACAASCGTAGGSGNDGGGESEGGSATISCTSPGSGCVAYFDAPASFQSNIMKTCTGQGQVVGTGCSPSGVEGCCKHAAAGASLSFETCIYTGCGAGTGCAMNQGGCPQTGGTWSMTP